MMEKFKVDLRGCRTIKEVVDKCTAEFDDDFYFLFNKNLILPLSSAYLYGNSEFSIDNQYGYEVLRERLYSDTDIEIELKERIEESICWIDTTYWGNQKAFPKLEGLGNIYMYFQNTEKYKKAIENIKKKADYGTEKPYFVWLELDMSDCEIIHGYENEERNMGFSLHEETHQYQRISPIFYKDEIYDGFTIYSGDFNKDDVEQKIKETFKRKDCDIETFKIIIKNEENGTEFENTIDSYMNENKEINYTSLVDFIKENINSDFNFKIILIGKTIVLEKYEDD